MPVPARRHSRSRVRRRRAHDAMKPQNVGACASCQAPLMPHRACSQCGRYKGKQVLNVSRVLSRASKKAASAHGHDHETKTQDQ